MNVRCFRDDVEPPRPRLPQGGEEKGSIENKNMVAEEIKANEKTDEGVESPKPQPMAFSIDFNEGKTVDMSKYENFMKRSQARHQRVQSMSASWQRPSPGNSQQQRPPMSAKLPRKAHGYHSEGYFSSDQEDTVIGASKNRPNQIDNKHQMHNCINNNFSPVGNERDSFRNKHLKLENYSSNNSPTAEKRNPFERSPDSLNSSLNRKSKSPMVDGIMSRSDILPSRQGLNLPLKHPYTSSLNRTNSEMMASPNYGHCPSSYTLRSPYIIEQSPDDVPMLADTSSPELDLLTPDNVQLTPGTPLRNSIRRDSSGYIRSFSPAPRTGSTTSPGVNLEHITRSPSVTRNIAVKTMQMLDSENDGNVSPSSTVSEAGTYTIETGNYTEEQKAKMNIDEMFGADEFKEPIMEALGIMHKPEIINHKFETKRDYVITKEPRFASGIREELLLAKNIPDPIRKVSTDKNVLEISCCYESPTESTNEPPQIAKHPKTAKSYLDKIKSRVKNISEKTFQKVPKMQDTSSADVGSFTSVTASGILSSNQKTSKPYDNREKLYRKNSLTKSQIDATEYIHHIPRDNLVLQTVSNESFVPKSSIGTSIISNTILTNTPQMDEKVMKTPEQILVGKLSHISLNRCQGDKSWIQEWADSVKKYNKEAVMAPAPDLALTGLPPVSPRHSVIMKGITSPVRSVSSSSGSPSKIPSPVGTLVRERPPIPDILSSTPDTESYLASTQSVISNLQAKLQKAKPSQLDSNVNGEYTHQILPDKCNNFTKLPVSQLSRSNSLNYRLHRRNADSLESSPLRNPGKYFITGNQAMPASTRLLLANLGASKSLDTQGMTKSDQSSPVRNKYIVGRNRYEEKGPDVVIGRLEVADPRLDANVTHSRHRSFDARSSRDFIDTLHTVMGDYKNANMTRSLTADSRREPDLCEKRSDPYSARSRQTIDQMRISSHGNHQILNVLRSNHQRGGSDTVSQISTNKHHNKQINNQPAVLQSSPIRRSSSFNVVNKNNNDVKSSVGSPRVSSRSKNFSHIRDDLQARNNTPEVDYMSEDSDNLSTGGFYSDYDRRSGRRTDRAEVPSGGARYNRAFALRRARLESPDLKVQQHAQHAPANSPRCPGTPEMRRKFSADRGAGQGRQRAQSRDARRPEPQQAEPKKREPAKQVATDRLTRSCSTAKDFRPKGNERSTTKKQPANPKEVEFTNWKKRASYDPFKAAQEGRRKPGNPGIKNSAGKVQEHLEEVISPSHSSPVHRSRSFHSPSSLAGHPDPALVVVDIPSSDPEDDAQEEELVCTTMGSPTHPTLHLVLVDADEEEESCGNKACTQDSSNRSRRQAQNNSVTLTSDYVTKFKVHPTEQAKRSTDPKRRPVDPPPDQLGCERSRSAGHNPPHQTESDTATTTTTTTNSGGSDNEVEPEWETRNVNVTMRGKSASVPPQHRHSGDFSVSSSTTSASKDVSKRPIQPRYMDISRYKSAEPSPAKNFLRRDPSKTYVAVLPSVEHRQQARRNTARQEQEMKIKELEKWKRRASYDPRKAAAQAKAKPSNKSPSSSVLRSQSFHGPMTQNAKLSVGSMDRSTGDMYYQEASSDNEF